MEQESSWFSFPAGFCSNLHLDLISTWILFPPVLFSRWILQLGTKWQRSRYRISGTRDGRTDGRHGRLHNPPYYIYYIEGRAKTPTIRLGAQTLQHWKEFLFDSTVRVWQWGGSVTRLAAGAASCPYTCEVVKTFN